MIAIIDYGAGNLRSVVNAIIKLGYQPIITSNPDEVMKAEFVILPGVGAAGSTVSSLNKLGLTESIKDYIASRRPFLGVCIGLQALFSSTDENGGHQCLGIIPGQVKKLPTGLKIPHMGWNQVKQKVRHPIFDGIADKEYFYFVHSYYAKPDDQTLVSGTNEYGIPFSSVIDINNLIATQFHPEKSGELGLKMYANFLKLASVYN
ncbi:MAG: imidazole glycerol phosphate synthase subunit HisH [Dehalococcoidia bacterium]|nr:MAG: imidazole glycerol phosphate synthase subunit HisH [Dehalococcoidia bacterium]